MKQSERLQRWLMPGPRLVTWVLGAAMILFLLTNVLEARWSDGFAPLRIVGIGGLLIGAWFARWDWLPRIVRHALAVLIGLWWAILNLEMPEPLVTLSDKGIDLLIRLVSYTRAIKVEQKVEEFYLFSLLALLAAFLLAYGTIWVLFRYGWGWRVVLFNSTLLMVNLTFTEYKSAPSFWLFMLCALLVIVYETFRARQRHWQQQDFDQQEWLSLRFLWAGLVAGIALVLLSQRLPAQITNAQLQVLGERVTQPFDTVSRWLDLSSSSDGTGGGGSRPGSAPPGRPNFSNRSVTLGGARVATNRIVLEVQASREEYWRSNAWDLYNGQGWENTTGTLAAQQLGTPTRRAAQSALDVANSMPQLDDTKRELFTQTITLRAERADQQLPAATTPYSWSLPVLVESTYIEAPDNEGMLPNFTDSSIYFSQLPTTEGFSYTVVSLISYVDKQSLRLSDTNYPLWTRRYLQLPISQDMRRIEGLARQITGAAGAENPYDKAVAIEDYLRKMPYDDQIPGPPPGVDPIANFLFNLKRGYCDYFAGSMVLMLRSQGVPARWVQGYATGELDPASGAYIVRDTIAHSWPEVYFTGYGWIRFEPTPAGYVTVPDLPEAPPFVASNGEDDIGPNGGIPNTAPPVFDASTLESVKEQLDNQPPLPTPDTRAPLPAEDQAAVAAAPMSPIMRGFTLLLVLAALVLLTVWYLLRRATRGLPPVARAYVHTGTLARWGGWGQRPDRTPTEYAEDLGNHLKGDRPALRRLATAYTKEQYSRTRRNDVEQVLRDSRQINRPLWRRVIQQTGHNFWALVLRQRERSRNRHRSE